MEKNAGLILLGKARKSCTLNTSLFFLFFIKVLLIPLTIILTWSARSKSAIEGQALSFLLLHMDGLICYADGVLFTFIFMMFWNF